MGALRAVVYGGIFVSWSSSTFDEKCALLAPYCGSCWSSYTPRTMSLAPAASLEAEEAAAAWFQGGVRLMHQHRHNNTKQTHTHTHNTTINIRVDNSTNRTNKMRRIFDRDRGED